MPTNLALEIIPLGGLGEFGMNLMLYRYGSDCLIVDAGMMFPGQEHLGVDAVVPDLAFLRECGTIHGVVATHGHDDHVGALPYLLARHDVPVYGSPFTRALVSNRLAEYDRGSSRALRLLPGPGEPFALGPFVVEALTTTHSIPQSRLLFLRTPGGNVVHATDFKLDPAPPDGEGTDLDRLAAIGREGVLALLSDSTNADRPGTTPGESTLFAGFDELFRKARQRILVTTFASNLHRVSMLARMAQRHGRRFALVGTSLQRQVETAAQLGLVRFPPGVQVSADKVMSLPPEHALIVATGSQGEPLSALARIAVGRHRDVAIEPGDLVIHSARRIPGNEKAIGRVFNLLLRQGADVITADDRPVHVSGHPSRDELVRMLEVTRPRFLVPIHGEYRQLHGHARIGVETGLDPSAVLLAESGDVVRIGQERIETVDRVPAGQIFIDDERDEVDRAILSDRRRIADDGLLVVAVAIDRDGRILDGYPEIVSRGFVPDRPGEEAGVLREAEGVVVKTLRSATAGERSDEAVLKARIQDDLRRFLRRRTRRQPLIVPLIMEF